MRCLHSLYAVVCGFILHSASSSTFSVGLRFLYWPKSADNPDTDYGFKEDPALYIDGPKYSDFKEELMESGKCDLFAFRVLMDKCSELMLCGNIKGMTATSEGTELNKYGLNEGDPITLHHVHCVVAYCDLTDFCTAFSGSFRAEYFGESLESIKGRNRCFFFVAKGLREAVECFGESGEIKGPFYSGMSCVLHLTEFGIRLNGPTSTSMSRAVAIRFAGERGVVLRMNNDYPWLHFLNCVPFSQFPEEDERLFIGGRYPLKMESVLMTETSQNFAKFFGVLWVFDAVVSGGDVREHELPPKKQHSKLDRLIKRCLGDLKETEVSFPDFVNGTFECFRQNKTEIVMDLMQLDEDYMKVFYESIMHSVAERGWDDEEDTVNQPKWDKLLAIFPNVRRVTVSCGYRGRFGLSLTVLLRVLNEAVFPRHQTLEEVVCTNVGDKGIAAAKSALDAMDQSGIKLLIDEKSKSFAIVRV